MNAIAGDTAQWWAYDFEICVGVDGLKLALATVNYHGYDVVALTQNGDIYTLVFRRPTT